MRPAPRRLVPRTTGYARATILGAIAIAAVLTAASPAPAALRAVDQPPGDARVLGAGPAPTVSLPGSEGPTASASRASGATIAATTDRWLIGVRGDHRRIAGLVRRAGGTFDPSLGFASVPVDHANRLAHALGHQLRWAGPDVKGRRLASFEKPGGVISPWSRSVGDIPPLAAPNSSLAPIGIVDDAVSHEVAELSGTVVVNHARTTVAHGTMVASVAAAPWNGVGVVGVAPHAPVLSWGTSFYCGDAAQGIITLVRRGAKVINLSLGFPQNCFTLWSAISYAYARGTVVVAAAGNDGDEGNTLTYPASYPHVITAGAVDADLAPAAFSNYDDYVDVAAPGVAVPVDVPKSLDHGRGRGTPYDGLAAVSGTSFAAPYVSGAMSWLLGARPDLDPGQAAAVLRASAKDLSSPGWDQHTGYGLVQVVAAMSTPAPPRDLLEPNDDPAFTRAASKGLFGKPTVWAGGAPVTLDALGDSADDPVDAYRVKVPAHTRVQVDLQATAGLTDLYAFDQSVVTFGGPPVAHSTNPDLEPDTLTLDNDGDDSRVAFVVVNSVAHGSRTLSAYALTIARA